MAEELLNGEAAVDTANATMLPLDRLLPEPTVDSSTTPAPTEMVNAGSLLDKLPAELRNTVYSLVLTQENHVKVAHWKSFTPALLQTCTAIRTEAKGIFWSTNVFEVEFDGTETQLHLATKWLKMLDADQATLVTRLTIRVRLSDKGISRVRDEAQKLADNRPLGRWRNWIADRLLPGSDNVVIGYALRKARREGLSKNAVDFWFDLADDDSTAPWDIGLRRSHGEAMMEHFEIEGYKRVVSSARG